MIERMSKTMTTATNACNLFADGVNGIQSFGQNAHATSNAHTLVPALTPDEKKKKII